ncbi:MAG: OmpH family outer membrane protein [Pseudomonadota bacterium]
MRFVAALLILLVGSTTVVWAQSAPLRILIVDRERALTESEPAQRIAARERAERLSLRAFNDELQVELETEEAEIAALRETSTKEEFEERVRAFNVKVRDARQTSQRNIQAFQRRFEEARSALAERLTPLLIAMLEETGADLILDARDVLVARPGADVTDRLIERLNASAPLEAVPPAQDE